MKRCVAGAIIGAALTVSVSAAADSINFVGKKVQSEIQVINSATGQIVDTAIVVDGRSFAPVRNTYEKAGYDVEYKSGVVYLKDPKSTETPDKYKDMDLVESRKIAIEDFKRKFAEFNLKDINRELTYYKHTLPNFEEGIKDPSLTDERKFELQWVIDIMKLKIEELERLKLEKENEEKDS